MDHLPGCSEITACPLAPLGHALSCGQVSALFLSQALNGGQVSACLPALWTTEWTAARYQPPSQPQEPCTGPQPGRTAAQLRPHDPCTELQPGLSPSPGPPITSWPTGGLSPLPGSLHRPAARSWPGPCPALLAPPALSSHGRHSHRCSPPQPPLLALRKLRPLRQLRKQLQGRATPPPRFGNTDPTLRNQPPPPALLHGEGGGEQESGAARLDKPQEGGPRTTRLWLVAPARGGEKTRRLEAEAVSLGKTRLLAERVGGKRGALWRLRCRISGERGGSVVQLGCLASRVAAGQGVPRAFPTPPSLLPDVP